MGYNRAVFPAPAQTEYYSFFSSLFAWFQYFVTVFWRESFFGLDLLTFWTSFWRGV